MPTSRLAYKTTSSLHHYIAVPGMIAFSMARSSGQTKLLCSTRSGQLQFVVNTLIYLRTAYQDNFEVNTAQA